MKRIRIGELFGSKGVFISKPGKDVTVAGSELLMDTRFEYLEIHKAGRFDLDVTDTQGDGFNIYYSQVFEGHADFPSLGYEPLVYTTMSFANAQGIADDNLGWYPAFQGWADTPVSGGFDIFGANGSENLTAGVVQCGYYLSNNNTRLNYNMNFIYISNHIEAIDVNVDYIIFKNRAV